MAALLLIFAVSNRVSSSLKVMEVFEESYDQISNEILTRFDSLFETAGVRDDPFNMVIYLIDYFSEFQKGKERWAGDYFTLNEILTKRKSNPKSSAIATVAIMRKFNWDVQLIFNEIECYLGLNLSAEWKVRKGVWIEKDGRRYYLKEFDTKTPVGKLKYDNPNSFYQSLKLPCADYRPIPLIKKLPEFSKKRVYKNRLEWSFKNKNYQLAIEIPIQLANWTANLPPSLYGMVSPGIEELNILKLTPRLKSLCEDFDEFDQVNFLLKFCQSKEIFIYDKRMPIKSVANQLIEGRNDCDGRSVFLFCLLFSVLDYPDTNIVFLSWPNHIALGLKPKTEKALMKLKESGFYVGDNYFILDPAYLGDTEWGSKTKFLTDECEIIKIDAPLR